MTDLLNHWRETLARLDRAGSLVETIGQDLLDRWSEPHRHYHNTTHLAFLLSLLTNEKEPLLLAAWFHDAVYDPHAADNEEQSSNLAAEQLGKLTLPPAMIEEVCRLVLLTKSHSTNPQDSSGKILLDADLAILGSPRAEYDRYAQAIRREYEWVPETEYRAGRVKILRSFLERPFLYHTDNFRKRSEIPARANLREEIAQLGKELG